MTLHTGDCVEVMAAMEPESVEPGDHIPHCNERCHGDVHYLEGGTHIHEWVLNWDWAGGPASYPVSQCVTCNEVFE